MVECITSKVGVNLGAFGDCIAFTNKGSKHKELNALTKFRYHSSGCELLYNGMTGEQLEMKFTLVQHFIYDLNICLRIRLIIELEDLEPF